MTDTPYLCDLCGTPFGASGVHLGDDVRLLPAPRAAMRKALDDMMAQDRGQFIPSQWEFAYALVDKLAKVLPGRTGAVCEGCAGRIAAASMSSVSASGLDEWGNIEDPETFLSQIRVDDLPGTADEPRPDAIAREP